MRKRILITSVTVLLLLAGAQVCQSGRDPQTAQEAYERYVTVWHNFAYDSTYVVWEYYDYCWREFTAFGQLDLYKDSLIAIALVDLGTADPELSARYLALEMLGRFRTPLTDSVLSRLITEKDPLAVDAARIMIRRGYWDLAAPVLIENRYLGDLGNDPRALPILQEAFDKSNNPLARLDLARMLTYRFNQSGLLLPAARQLLAELPKEEQYDAVRIEAIRELQEAGDEQDLDLFTNIATTDPVLVVRWNACGALIKMAKEGNARALSELRRLSEESPYMDMRETLAAWLHKIAGEGQK
jgi:HEAT repeat protein